jgi:hypothetical protein
MLTSKVDHVYSCLLALKRVPDNQDCLAVGIRESRLLVYRQQTLPALVEDSESFPPVCFETFCSRCPEVAHQGYQVKVSCIASIMMLVEGISIVAELVTQEEDMAGKGNNRYSALKLDLYH